MSKSDDLVSQAKQLPAASTRRGNPSWHEAMRAKDPESMAQLDQLVEAYNAGDLTVQFPDTKVMWSWLKSQRKIPSHVSAVMFRRYVKFMKDGDTDG